MAKVTKKTGNAILGISKKDKLEAEYIRSALAIQAEIDRNKANIKELQSRLSPIEDYFMEMMIKGEVIACPAGSVTKNISNSYMFKPEYYKNFKDLYKRKVSDFVIEKISYGVTPALRKLLTDTKYEHSDLAREAVIIECRETIQFKVA